MDLKYFKKFVNSKSKIVVCMWATAEPGGASRGPRPPLKSVKFFNPHLYSKAQHKGQSMQRCFVLKFFGYRP